MIARVVGIHGEHRLAAPIGSPRDFFGENAFGHAVGLADGLFGKFGAKAVFSQYGEAVEARVVGSPDRFDDHALGVGVAIGPFIEAHHDAVAHLGAREGFLEIDVDVASETGIVRNDVMKPRPALEDAEDARVGAREDADDAAAPPRPAGRPARICVEAGNHAVAVQGCPRVLRGNENIAFGRSVGGGLGHDEPKTAFVHFDAAGDEVGLGGQEEAVAAHADDPALLDEGIHGATHPVAFARRDAQAFDDLADPERLAAGRGEQMLDSRFEADKLGFQRKRQSLLRSS